MQINAKKSQKTLGTRLSRKLKLKFSGEIIFDHGLSFIFFRVRNSHQATHQAWLLTRLVCVKDLND